MTFRSQLTHLFRASGSRSIFGPALGHVASTAALLMIVAWSSCRMRTDVLDAEQVASIQDSVRLMAAAVSQDVTREGPKAWVRYFAHSPRFFMVSEGRLVFPDIDSAIVAVDSLVVWVRSIQLTWGDITVEPFTSAEAGMSAPYHEVITMSSGQRIRENGYCTAIVERTTQGWQFRSLHWSLANRESQ